MQQDLASLKAKALASLAQAKDKQSLWDLEVKFLGRKGELTAILRKLKDLTLEEKQKFGKSANDLKLELQFAFNLKKEEIFQKSLTFPSETDLFDVTEPGQFYPVGHAHPIFKVQYEIEDIFRSMGFMVEDGPELESEYYNFEALNVPSHHPARDMQDTFFLTDGNLLRTHTSPVQIRAMLKYGAPIKTIVPGRVFRYEALDASHSHTFYQVEGMMLDKNISIANLAAIMEEALSTLFKGKVKVRLRPGYFPFVEPGMELDFSCLLCGGKGCRVCKHTGWMEFMGCGMVHENVLKAGHIDPKVYQGFAFGFGLDRLVMMRYGIDDIRLFHEGDLRFVRQF